MCKPEFDYRKPIRNKPHFFKSGEPVICLHKKLVERKDEIALGIEFICRRQLFGSAYRRLVGSYFWNAPKNSGVMIAPFTMTHDIFPDRKFPGDVDLLVIPYENDELVLSRTLAIELKVVRATYLKQSKSPNDYGFSQALGLLDFGLPYAAVGHLIVSDVSPKDAWRTTSVATVISAEDGRISPLREIQMDLMPLDLLRRSFGRLSANTPNDQLGFFAVYLSDDRNHHWEPEGKVAMLNSKYSHESLDQIAQYYDQNPDRFFMTPRFDPV